MKKKTKKKPLVTIHGEQFTSEWMTYTISKRLRRERKENKQRRRMSDKWERVQEKGEKINVMDIGHGYGCDGSFMFSSLKALRLK